MEIDICGFNIQKFVWGVSPPDPLTFAWSVDLPSVPLATPHIDLGINLMNRYPDLEPFLLILGFSSSFRFDGKYALSFFFL